MLGKLKVTYSDDSTVEVTTKPGDAVKFERQFKIPVVTALPTSDDDVMFLEHLWFFAWAAAGRDGEERDFDTWCDSVDRVEIAGGRTSAPKRGRTSSP